MARSLLTMAVCGTLLTVLFWGPLWRGGGFIGGDTYTYFLPQKAFLADRLQAGELPFWNNRTGHGYPLIGESQTAVLYPVNWLLYGLFDLNTAYVASHLLHYILAFVGMGLLGRRLGLNGWGSLLAAVVYVYGWFPPRACLEWAIIGGAYLPWTLWCLEGWFQTWRIRYGVGLALLLALDLLAGHFNLAFITTVGLGVYALQRALVGGETDTLSLAGGSPNVLGGSAGEIGIATCGGEGEVAASRNTRIQALIVPLVGIVLGYLLAAPQLVPSWSLKRASQRTEVSEEFDPGYGHIPPWYLCQMATPWLWFTSETDPDQALNSVSIGNISSATNKVEAHLYFGLIPLLLALIWLGRAVLLREPTDARIRWLAWIGLIAMIYATGWLLPVAKYLPGFGYFRGPGRWGLLTTLAVALISGSVLTRWTNRSGLGVRCLLAVALIGLTTYDLYVVSRHQWYTFIVSDPPIAHRHESDIGRLLTEYERVQGPPRMLSPGPNLATLCGQAATPPYLGFGPDAYYLSGGRLPDPRFLQYLSGEKTPDEVDSNLQFHWLRDAGVTHILSMKPLPTSFPVTETWRGFDRLLNPAWARMSVGEPLYLYAIDDAPGRLSILSDDANASGRVVSYAGNRVEVHVVSRQSSAIVSLNDLAWPEWNLEVDGKEFGETQQMREPMLPEEARLLKREVPLEPGEHRLIWTYHPQSLWWGCGLAAVSLLSLLGLAIRYRR